MTEAEALIQDYGGPFRDQALELAQNIITLQRKIDEARPTIENEPLFVVDRVGDKNPHDVRRENRAWVSFRAQVKAHHDALFKLQELIGAAYPTSDTNDPLQELVDAIRSDAAGRVQATDAATCKAL